MLYCVQILFLLVHTSLLLPEPSYRFFSQFCLFSMLAPIPSPSPHSSGLSFQSLTIQFEVHPTPTPNLYPSSSSFSPPKHTSFWSPRISFFKVIYFLQVNKSVVKIAKGRALATEILYLDLYLCLAIYSKQRLHTYLIIYFPTTSLHSISILIKYQILTVLGLVTELPLLYKLDREQYIILDQESDHWIMTPELSSHRNDK